MIREAFLLLLKEKPFEKITVTDIVKKADINRATFYAHYTRIGDLVTEFEDEILDKLHSVLSEFSFKEFAEQPSKHPTRLLLEISKFLDQSLEVYRIFLENTDTTEFIEKLGDIFIDYLKNDTSIPDEIKNSKKFLIRTYYVAGGIASVYENWLKGKLSCSIYDIPLELGEILMETRSNPLKR